MKNEQFEDALKQINFPIEIQSISGIPEEMGRKVVRLDHAPATPLGIVGSRYQPIHHMEAFNGALKSMESGGLDFTNAQLKVHSYEMGAMAKMELLLPAHHTKIGNHDLSLKYVARNSYNGRWKFQGFFGWMNHVCFNTLVTGQKLAYTANRHTKSFDIEASNMKIKNAVNAVTNATGAFQRWWDIKVEDDAVADMFTKTIAKMPLSEGAKLVAKSETNKKQLYILMGLYNEEVKQLHGSGDYGRKDAKGSLWCAYQASTAWSTHLNDITIREKGKQHIVQYQRQNEVRKMLNSKSWSELEYA